MFEPKITKCSEIMIYSMATIRQSICLVINPITVDGEMNLKYMFPCAEGGVYNIDELIRSNNKGELQEELEINCSVPDKLTAEIPKLNNEIKCLKAEIRTIKIGNINDEQIKEQPNTGKGKGDWYSGRSYSSENKVKE